MEAVVEHVWTGASMPIELLRVLMSKEFNIPLDRINECDAHDLLVSWNILQTYNAEVHQAGKSGAGSE